MLKLLKDFLKEPLIVLTSWAHNTRLKLYATLVDVWNYRLHRGGMLMSPNVARGSNCQIDTGKSKPRTPMSSKMEVIPHDVQVRIMSCVVLTDFPVVAKCCILWHRLSVEAFHQWFRWRCIPRRTLLDLPSTHRQHQQQATYGSPIVARSGGCVEFAEDGTLWVQSAVPAEQAVNTTEVSISPTDGALEFEEHPLRSWPYECIIGGLPGGMVAHSRNATTFFPPANPSVVAHVPREYDNILHAGEQIFLLRRRTRPPCADLLHPATKRTVRLNLAAFFTALGEASVGATIKRSAVSATEMHFVMYQSARNGMMVAAAVRLPNVLKYAECHTSMIDPTVSFARSWPREHPIASNPEPHEVSVGDCMLLHGETWRDPVCVLHSATGTVDAFRLKQGGGLLPNAIFVQTTMNKDHTLFFGCVQHPAGPHQLCVWHTSGPLITLIDLGAHLSPELKPTQLAVHPSHAAVAINLCEDERDTPTTMFFQFGL